MEKITKREMYEAIKGEAGLDHAAPTPRIAKFLRDWAVSWECTPRLVIYALQQSANVMSDANKLLKKWVASGITEPEQVEEKEKKLLPKRVEKSYTTDKVGRNSVLDWARKYAEGEDK